MEPTQVGFYTTSIHRPKKSYLKADGYKEKARFIDSKYGYALEDENETGLHHASDDDDAGDGGCAAARRLLRSVILRQVAASPSPKNLHADLYLSLYIMQLRNSHGYPSRSDGRDGGREGGREGTVSSIFIYLKFYKLTMND